MEARGYQPGEKRTRYKVLKMRTPDWILLGGAALLLIGMIVLAYVI
jgi:energy-coupling factor transport system permease protein